MGAEIEELKDGMVIYQRNLKGANLDSRKDHRMVMSMTVAGLRADGRTRIHDAGCVRKTFPHFADQMMTLGAYVETNG
jgi:3-phosphoshikimate 1-carboxyvinyltransferase